MKPSIRRLTILAALAILAAACHRTPMQRLIAASGGIRFTEARLCGFGYASLPVSLNTADVRLLAKRSLLLDTVANVSGNDSQSLRTKGVAQLLVGNAAAAVELLRLASTKRAAGPDVWNDLAASLIHLANLTKDARLFADALYASDHALRKSPTMAEAHFNRALALSKLHLNILAGAEFTQLLNNNDAWSSEIRTRARRTQQRTRRLQWRDIVPRLGQAVDEGNSAEVDTIVAAFPQESRSWAEAEFLGRWAEAVEASDVRAAIHNLRLARAIANALCRQSHEYLLRDSVELIYSSRGEDYGTLVAAHRRYRNGRRAYAAGRLTRAAVDIDAAENLFRRGKSPMALVAAYYAANVRTDQSQPIKASTLSILQHIPKRYRALQAQCAWLQGTRYARAGKLFEALEAYTDAQNKFDGLREFDNANFMRTARATLLNMLGDKLGAWHETLEAWAYFADSGDYWSLAVGVVSLADSEMRAQCWSRALALLTASSALLPSANNPRLEATVPVWRALAAMKVKPEDAPSELSRARGELARVQDETMRLDALNELRIAEAAGSRDMMLAERLLDASIKYARSRGQLTRMPDLFVARARVHARRGEEQAAVTDYREAVQIIETRRQGIEVDALRDSYFGTSSAAYGELVAALHASHEDAEAFDVAEQGRARSYLDRFGLANSATAPHKATRLRQLLPDRSLLLELVATDNTLFRFTLSKAGLDCKSVSVPKAVLASTIATLNRSIRANDFMSARAVAAQLYTWLIGTDTRSTKMMIVVADDAVANVPFGALFDERRKRFVIESSEVVMAPSATAFVHRARHVRLTNVRVLAVGDPAPSRMYAAAFGRLPGAAEEARRVAHMYQNVTLMTAEAATPINVAAALQYCAIAHIAAHTVTSDTEPSRSCILLAPTADGRSALYLSDIARENLHGVRLVILAGCRTAQRPLESEGDIRSLASGFLIAGATDVVASLWDLDDLTALRFDSRLHGELRRGTPPIAAIRAVQISLLRSQDKRESAIGSWAGVQIIGNID